MGSGDVGVFLEAGKVKFIGEVTKMYVPRVSFVCLLLFRCPCLVGQPCLAAPALFSGRKK